MPQTYDMGPTALLPLRRKECWGFFRPKILTALAGFEPSNLGTKGQHATPQVNYTVKKAWKALHFTLRILKKGNSNTTRFSCMSIIRPILDYGAAWWDPHREVQTIALGRVQNKAAKFTHHTSSSDWETLASRRMLSRICAFFKTYSGERAWKAIGDRLQRPHYLSRVDHERKIKSRRQRTDIGKYSFVNRTIQHWNGLPADVLRILSLKPIIFKKRARKVIIEVS